MIIHCDGDLLVYRAGFAAEKTHYYVTYWDEDFDETRTRHFQYKKEVDEFSLDRHVLKVTSRREAEPVENALYNVKNTIARMLNDLQADQGQMILYLSGPDNFREGIATLKPYKGNRDPEHKPVHGPDIKAYMDKKYGVIWSEGEEADDTIGHSHYAMWCRDPYSSVIASVDKDLMMIPGLHYNFVKEERKYVDEKRADKNFYHQLLVGDSTDNIPGVPGIGAKRAAEALEDCTSIHTMYDRCATLYVQGYGKERAHDALIENARLLWIRREPYEMWLPPEVS